MILFLSTEVQESLHYLNMFNNKTTQMLRDLSKLVSKSDDLHTKEPTRAWMIFYLSFKLSFIYFLNGPFTCPYNPISNLSWLN
jgi:hypothetical protein